MIDIHTHIVFGVDDGARDFEESKEMIRIAMADGTTKMVATSHFEREAFKYPMEDYHKNFDEINKWCKEEGLDFEILTGHEFFLEPNALKRLSAKECLSINKTKYLLVELSNYVKFDKLEEMLDLVSNMGYQIIIAHTERVKWVLEDFNIIKDWYDKGYNFQINAISLLRKDYKENYKSAHKLLKNGYVHAIASDGHRKDRRKPNLKRAYDYVASCYDVEIAQLLFVNNPSNIINNIDIEGLKEYKSYKKYTFRRLFKSLKGVK